MISRLLLAALLALLPLGAEAANCNSNPFTLTNGQTADATQVMANFNNLLNCSNNNLAHNGANSDITSLSGLTTALSVPQGGTGATSFTATDGVLIGNGTTSLVTVGHSTAGNVLTSNGATWLSTNALPGPYTFSGPTVFTGTVTHQATTTMSGAALNEAFATITAASTTDLGTLAANYAQIANTTGATSISALGTAPAGKEVDVVFVVSGGSITLVNGVNFVLLGSVNILVANQDTMRVRSNGSGAWTMIAYSRANGYPLKGVAQVVNFETGAVATGTTIIPQDDTIPQNTEGDQYMSLSITPTMTTSTLIIDVTTFAANTAGSAGGPVITALFQDATAGALAAGASTPTSANLFVGVVIRHKMTAGTTSATTFKVRIGGASAGTTTFNGFASGRIFGGVMASSITITEILP